MSNYQNAFHVRKAELFYNDAGRYVGIGKSTVWPNELIPPTPDGTELVLTEPIGYKPVEVKKYVIPDEGGAFSWGGQNWTEVQPANIYTQNASYVYVEFRLEYDELPLVQYREVGVFSGLTHTGGAGALLPGVITDVGKMEMLDNRIVSTRVIDKVDVIAYVIRF